MLNDTADNTLIKIVPQGNLIQETVAGNQLYNKNTVYAYSSAVTFLEDDWISFEYTNTTSSLHFENLFTRFNSLIKPNTNYNLIVEVKDVETTGELTNYTYFALSSSSESDVSQFNITKRFFLSDVLTGGFYKFITLSQSDFTNCSICLRTFLEVEVGVSVKMKVRISILEDTTITKDNFVYEKFVGGSPSPNSDYPQEIKVGTGNQNIKVVNKNMIPTPSSKTSSNVTFTCKDTTLTINGTNNSYVYGPYIPFTLPAGTYTLCYKYISGTVIDYGFSINVNYAANLKVIASLNKGLSNYTTNAFITFTLTKKTDIRVFFYTGNTTRIFNNLKIDVQLIKGAETDYNMVAHQEQNYTLPLDSLELLEIKEKDLIFKNEIDSEFYNSNLEKDMWYILKINQKIILNNEDDWTLSTVKDLTQVFVTNMHGFKQNTPCKCNYFRNNINGDVEKITISDLIYVAIKKIKARTVEEFENYLVDHPLIVCGEKASPTYQKVTNSILITKLEELNDKMRSYKGKTIITCFADDEDNESLSLEVSTPKDLDTVLDNINNAILEIGGGE